MVFGLYSWHLLFFFFPANSNNCSGSVLILQKCTGLIKIPIFSASLSLQSRFEISPGQVHTWQQILQNTETGATYRRRPRPRHRLAAFPNRFQKLRSRPRGVRKPSDRYLGSLGATAGGAAPSRQFALKNKRKKRKRQSPTLLRLNLGRIRHLLSSVPSKLLRRLRRRLVLLVVGLSESAVLQWESSGEDQLS